MPRQSQSNESIVNKLNSLGLKYDFSEFKYNGNRNNKSIVICPIHGSFEISYHYIIKSRYGLICKKCRNKNIQNKLFIFYNTPTKKYNGYWTHKRCAKEALLYKSKTMFSKYSKGAYKKARIYGWLDDICKHMSIIGDRKHKCIYSYEFPDNHVYVGLTYNTKKRQNHRNSDPYDQVTKYIKETGLIPIHKQLTEYIPVDEAIKLENDFIQKYKNENWIILNKNKAGGIGGNTLYWTYEKCLKEALKYSNKKMFLTHSRGAYQSAYRNKWLNNICSHMNKYSFVQKLYF